MAENDWDGKERRELERRQFALLEKKLDEHAEVLNGMRETLASIAIQQIHIQTLQAMQTEMRGDINEIFGRIEKLTLYQSSCPRKHMSSLWAVVVSVTVMMLGTYVAHVMGGK